MKLIVNELFEQGLARANGGMIRLRPGEYQAEAGQDGSVHLPELKRSIPADAVANLKALGLISVE